ncbi:hypothetical protein A5669_04980 [Mycolicibacterium fortuitum]|nr:hypothetical protein A5669_04980 [Mycolicibacterium fortuitum]
MSTDGINLTGQLVEAGMDAQVIGILDCERNRPRLATAADENGYMRADHWGGGICEIVVWFAE